MITKTFARFFFGVLLFLTGMSGCTQQQKPTPIPTITPTPPGASLLWEKLAEEDGAAGEYRYEDTTPRLVLISSEALSSTLQNQLRPAYLDLITQTDFSAYFVAVIYQGRKATTKYSVEVLDVRQVDRIITIYALFHEPRQAEPGEIVSVNPLVTSPYCMVKIQKPEPTRGDFTFVLIANGQEVARQIQTFP